MRSVDEALARILADATPLAGEVVPLAACLGRVLVDPLVVATHAVPPFTNSAMDGYAVRRADLPGELRLVGESRAGNAGLTEVGAGMAMRIMTGAPFPAGADAVVPIEHADERGQTVAIAVRPEPGAHVRTAGHDTQIGDAVEVRGELAPAGIALLASLGIGQVEVRRRPRVAVLSTGDELVAPGEPLGPGQIHDTNGVALATAVIEAGGEPILLDRAADDAAEIGGRLREASERADLILSSGGVSVGLHDHVRTAIEELGALDFWRIAVQPGKPLAYGSVGGRPLIGLPGNPVSALVTFELFVRPLIRAMLGLSGDGRLRVLARLDREVTKDPARRAFLRVALARSDAEYVAVPAGGQGSSQLRPLADGNGLLIVPEGEPAALPGRWYEALVVGALR